MHNLYKDQIILVSQKFAHEIFADKDGELFVEPVEEETPAPAAAPISEETAPEIKENAEEKSIPAAPENKMLDSAKFENKEEKTIHNKPFKKRK